MQLNVFSFCIFILLSTTIRLIFIIRLPNEVLNLENAMIFFLNRLYENSRVAWTREFDVDNHNSRYGFMIQTSVFLGKFRWIFIFLVIILRFAKDIISKISSYSISSVELCIYFDIIYSLKRCSFLLQNRRMSKFSLKNLKNNSG